MRGAVLAAALWVLGVQGGAAQVSRRNAPSAPPAAAPADTVDRIVAIVGNTVILDTEVDEELFIRYPDQSGLPPAGSDQFRALRAQLLRDLIDLELLYQRALGDTTVKVTDEQVNSAVDQAIRSIRQRVPSEAAFRAELRETGFQTPEEHRRWLTERQRKTLLTNTLVEQLEGSGKLKPVVPTEREMRAFFEAQKGTQRRPETVSFRQVVISPRPTAEAKARALARADSILRELRAGADFATAARRFSMDSTSREQGGTVGWFRRGVMHQAFEDVAFALRPGVVSDPVETPFGYHLIQVQRVQPAEVMARHILLMPDICPADADSARALAQQVHAALARGAPIDSLQRLYHDPLEERDVRAFPAERLPAAYREPLGTLTPPALTPVFTLPGPLGDPLRAKYAILQLEERLSEGELRYEDVKDQIRAQLGKQMMLRRFLDGLRRATYVEVRGP